MKRCILFAIVLLQALICKGQIDTIFWFAPPDLEIAHQQTPIRFCFTTYDEDATIVISQPANSWFSPDTILLAADSFYVYDLSPIVDSVETKPMNTVLNRGFLITSTALVSCYYESVGNNSEIYTLKGTSGFGLDFLVPMQNHLPNHYSNSPASIEIIATEDSTIVQITAPVALAGGIAADSTVTIVLQRGQSYAVHAASTSASAHLHNTIIHSNKPIVVNSTDDSVDSQQGCHDLMGEQIVPLTQLGTRYVAVRNDSEFERIFIYPVEDSTTVYLNNVAQMPIDRGEWINHPLTNSEPACLITSDKPVAVFQMTGIGCEVGGTMLPHIDCTGSRKVTHLRPNVSSSIITIVVESEYTSDFIFNGRSDVITAADFTPLPADTTISYCLKEVGPYVSTGSVMTIRNSSRFFHLGILDGTPGGDCSYGFFSNYGRTAILKFDESDTVRACLSETIYLHYRATNIDSLTLFGPNGLELTTPPFILHRASPTMNGRYYIEGIDTSGCEIHIATDSVYILVDTCPGAHTLMVNEYVCSDEMPVIWNGQTYDSAGTYIDTIVSIYGHDSIIILNITVFPNYNQHVYDTICSNQTYSFGDSIFIGANGSSLYADSLLSVYNCDSTVILSLTVHPSYNHFFHDTICDNLNYTFDDSTYNVTGVYGNQYTTHEGCDSIRTLELTVFPHSDTAIYDTIMYYERYFFEGDTLNTQGVYRHTFGGANGCDSIRTLHLRVVPQIITGVNLVADLCAGSQKELTFGFTPEHTVQLEHGISTLGHSDRIFLPDGVPCGDMGCSYRSTVTFTDFAPESQISSVEDIQYVLLNIEHSYVGDIYINITCPNGQSADLMRYGGSGSSNCLSAIGASHRGWDGTQSNVQTGSYFGIPVDEGSSNKCDSTEYGNRPGTGWNYCWSDNSTSGYTYGAGDGRIYRAGNYSGGHIDSSHVSSGTNFYHPDDSFTNLVGCPLNGEWYIEIYDGWGDDNGYVFGWALALDPELLPRTDTCEMNGYYVDGAFTNRRDSITFLLDVPEDLDRDTTITYRFSVSTTCGDLVDTFATVTLHPSFTQNNITVADICSNQTMTFRDSVFHGENGSTLYTDSLKTANGCDSLLTLQLTVHDIYSTVDKVHSCDSLVWLDGITYRADTFGPSYMAQSVHGCDSLVTLNLSLGHTRYGAVEEVVACDGYLWIDGNYYDSDTIGATYAIRGADGCDSIVTLNLFAHYFTEVYGADTFCFNEVYYWHGHVLNDDHHVAGERNYRAETFDLVDTLKMVNGCDSIIYMTLTKVAQPRVTISDDINCDVKGYNLEVSTDEPLYTSWSSSPHDSLLEGHEHEATVTVSPRSATEYYLYVDYSEEPYCPSTVVYPLRPLPLPEVELKVNPENLSYSHMDFTAYDVSRQTYQDRTWYIDGQRMSEKGKNISGRAADDADSVTVELELFDGKCSNSEIKILPVNKVALMAPNVFTPLRDNNDRFLFVMEGIIKGDLYIYNRDGLLVFHTTDIEQGWDGRRADGTLCPQGDYVWKLEYYSKVHPTAKDIEVGTVLLLK